MFSLSITSTREQAISRWELDQCMFHMFYIALRFKHTTSFVIRLKPSKIWTMVCENLHVTDKGLVQLTYPYGVSTYQAYIKLCISIQTWITWLQILHIYRKKWIIRYIVVWRHLSYTCDEKFVYLNHSYVTLWPSLLQSYFTLSSFSSYFYSQFRKKRWKLTFWECSQCCLCFYSCELVCYQNCEGVPKFSVKLLYSIYTPREY